MTLLQNPKKYFKSLCRNAFLLSIVCLSTFNIALSGDLTFYQQYHSDQLKHAMSETVKQWARNASPSCEQPLIISFVTAILDAASELQIPMSPLTTQLVPLLSQNPGLIGPTTDACLHDAGSKAPELLTKITEKTHNTNLAPIIAYLDAILQPNVAPPSPSVPGPSANAGNEGAIMAKITPIDAQIYPTPTYPPQPLFPPPYTQTSTPTEQAATPPPYNPAVVPMSPQPPPLQPSPFYPLAQQTQQPALPTPQVPQQPYFPPPTTQPCLLLPSQQPPYSHYQQPQQPQPPQQPPQQPYFSAPPPTQPASAPTAAAAPNDPFGVMLQMMQTKTQQRGIHQQHARQAQQFGSNVVLQNFSQGDAATINIKKLKKILTTAHDQTLLSFFTHPKVSSQKLSQGQPNVLAPTRHNWTYITLALYRLASVYPQLSSNIDVLLSNIINTATEAQRNATLVSWMRSQRSEIPYINAEFFIAMYASFLILPQPMQFQPYHGLQFSPHVIPPVQVKKTIPRNDTIAYFIDTTIHEVLQQTAPLQPHALNTLDLEIVKHYTIPADRQESVESMDRAMYPLTQMWHDHAPLSQMQFSLQNANTLLQRYLGFPHAQCTPNTHALDYNAMPGFIVPTGLITLQAFLQSIQTASRQPIPTYQAPGTLWIPPHHKSFSQMQAEEKTALIKLLRLIAKISNQKPSEDDEEEEETSLTLATLFQTAIVTPSPDDYALSLIPHDFAVTMMQKTKQWFIQTATLREQVALFLAVNGEITFSSTASQNTHLTYEKSHHHRRHPSFSPPTGPEIHGLCGDDSDDESPMSSSSRPLNLSDTGVRLKDGLYVNDVLFTKLAHFLDDQQDAVAHQYLKSIGGNTSTVQRYIQANDAEFQTAQQRYGRKQGIVARLAHCYKIEQYHDHADPKQEAAQNFVKRLHYAMNRYRSLQKAINTLFEVNRPN